MKRHKTILVFTLGLGLLALLVAYRFSLQPTTPPGETAAQQFAVQPNAVQQTVEPGLEDFSIGANRLGGDFTLTNQHGRPTRMSDFRNKAVLVSFGYTHCPDVCPLTLSEFKRVKRKLGELAERLAVLFITMDPERDTPEVLNSYISHFDPGFLGLTGTREALDEVAEKFRAQYRIQRTEGQKDYSVGHTTLIYLFGPENKVRYIFPFDQRAEVMADGVRAVLGPGA